MSTVFIIDDDSAVRDSLVAFVTSHGLAAEAFASAEEFLAAGSLHSPGCAVVDVRMTGMSGLDLLVRLKALGIQLPVVILTGHGDVPLAVRAMQSGAVTFLEKPCHDRQLWQAISSALNLDTSRRAEASQKQAIVDRFATLTPDETAVLEKMLSGLPNKRIASELDIGLRTVELRRSNIMRKLEAESLADVIRMAISIDFATPCLPAASTDD